MSDQAACAHLRCRARAFDHIGQVHCPDCGHDIGMDDAFNSYAQQIEEHIREFKALDISFISLRLGAIEERLKQLEAYKHSHG